MNIYLSLLITTIAGLSTLIGALFIYIPKYNNKYLCTSLMFSAIIMIGISLFDLIPNAYPILYNRFNYITPLIIMIILIISYIIILIISTSKRAEKGDLYKLGIISMIVLIIHNIPEGIITFFTSYINYKLGIKLAIAIALHNIPEGLSIAMPIYYATKNKRLALKKTLIAAASEPLGALIASIFLKQGINQYSVAVLLILVAGLMISVVIDDIVPEINNIYNKKSIIIGIILGIIILLIGVIIN